VWTRPITPNRSSPVLVDLLVDGLSQLFR